MNMKRFFNRVPVVIPATLIILALVCGSTAGQKDNKNSPTAPSSEQIKDAWKALQQIKNPDGTDSGEDEKIKQYIKELGDDDWRTREKATEKLQMLKSQAAGLIDRAIHNEKDMEIVHRLESIRSGMKINRIALVTDDLYPSAITLAQAKQKKIVPFLLDFLEHGDASIRHGSEYALRRITGKNFGYSALGSTQKQVDAINNWRDWWASDEEKFEFPKIKPFGIVICDGAAKKVIAVNTDGKTLWTKQFDKSPFSVHALDNGNIIVGFNGDGTNGTTGHAVEYDKDWKKVWSTEKMDLGVKGVCADVQRLGDGNTLLAYPHSGKVIVITPVGKIVWKKEKLNHPHAAQRLKNGNTLILEHVNDRVIEVDKAGKIVWEKKNLHKPADVRKLDNGNILIADFNGKNVIEVDRKGKVIWTRKCSLAPSGVGRLPNGQTIISAAAEGAIITGYKENAGKLHNHNNTWGKLRILPAAGMKRKQNPDNTQILRGG